MIPYLTDAEPSAAPEASFSCSGIRKIVGVTQGHAPRGVFDSDGVSAEDIIADCNRRSGTLALKRCLIEISGSTPYVQAPLMCRAGAEECSNICRAADPFPGS
jgi:hypothetical protein